MRNEESLRALSSFAPICLVPSTLDALNRPKFVELAKLRPRMAIFTGRSLSAFRNAFSYSGLVTGMRGNIITPLFTAYYLIETKTFSDTRYNRVGLYTRHVREISGDVIHPIDAYSSGSSRIPTLRPLVSPSAISRLIIPVIINPINAMISRLFAHIFGKVLKNKPPIANRNSSPPIMAKVRGVRIETALLHVYPGPIKRVRIFKRHNSSSNTAISVYHNSKKGQ